MKNSDFFLELKDKDFGEEVHDLAPDSYKIRQAARGIIIRGDEVALLDVTNKGFHKLPGGGIDEGESIEDGFKREVLEETGCQVSNLQQVGQVVEWRSHFGVKQISYIFFAKVVGDAGETSFDGGEIEDGFQLVWVPINKLKEVVSSDASDEYEAKFIIRRDSTIIDHFLQSQ